MAPKVDIVFSANTAGFAAGVGKVKQALNNVVPSELQSRLGSMFTGIFGVAAVRRILVAADDIATFSTRMRVSIRTLQEWQHAAAETDTSIQAFTTAFRTLVQAQADVVGGRNPEAEESFARMGLSLEKIKAMSPEQLFRAVADGVKRGGDNTEDLNAGITLMGRSALEVLPAMKRGLKEFADEAQRMGLIMNDDVVKRLADANDQIDRMKRQGTNIVANLLPGPVSGLDFLTTGLIGTAQMGKYYWQRLMGNNQGASETAGNFNRSWEQFEQRSGAYLGIGGMRSDAISAAELAERRRQLGIADPFNPVATDTGEMFGPPAPTVEALGSLAPTADALARIGLFRGGAGGVEGRLDRQIDELQRIRSELRELNNQARQE